MGGGRGCTEAERKDEQKHEVQLGLSILGFQSFTSKALTRMEFWGLVMAPLTVSSDVKLTQVKEFTLLFKSIQSKSMGFLNISVSIKGNHKFENLNSMSPQQATSCKVSFLPETQTLQDVTCRTLIL